LSCAPRRLSSNGDRAGGGRRRTGPPHSDRGLQAFADEVVQVNKHRIAPEGVDAAHPAFDITPNEFVTAIITEQGIARPPYTESLKALADSS